MKKSVGATTKLHYKMQANGNETEWIKMFGESEKQRERDMRGSDESERNSLQPFF